MANSTTNSSQSFPELGPFQLMAVHFASRGVVQIVLETVFVVVIVIVGFLGNIAVCVVILRNTAFRRKATNIAVIGLAVSDISLFVLGGPFVTTTIFQGRWIFRKQLCDFNAIILYSLSTISLYLMALIALNRFFCVVKPSKYNSIFTSKTTILNIFIIWSSVFGLNLAFYFAKWLHVYFHPYKAICAPFLNLKTPEGTFTANIVGGVFMVGLPVLILSFCYVRIAINIRQHHNRVTAAQSNREFSSVNFSRASELKMTRIMFAVVLGFFICWLPVFVIDVVANSVRPWVSMSRYAALITTFLVLLSSTLNPCILSVMNRTFRKEILKILQCKRSRVSTNSDVTQIQTKSVRS